MGIGMKNPRNNCIVFTGVAVGRQIGERELRGRSEVSYSDWIARRIDEKSKLAADFLPARVGVTDQDCRRCTEIVERDIAADSQTVWWIHFRQHGGEPGGGDQVSSTDELVRQGYEVFGTKRLGGTRVGAQPEHGYIG